jgi:hypothetical protein
VVNLVVAAKRRQSLVAAIAAVVGLACGCGRTAPHSSGEAEEHSVAHATIVEGVVTEVSGRPIPDIRISALNENYQAIVSATSDRSGAYRMDVSRGAYRLVAEGSRFVPSEYGQRGSTDVVRPVLVDGRSLRWNPILSPGGIIEGTVATSDGRQVAHTGVSAKIAVRDAARPQRADLPRPVGLTTTDRHGRYRLVLPPGIYTVSATARPETTPPPPAGTTYIESHSGAVGEMVEGPAMAVAIGQSRHADIVQLTTATVELSGTVRDSNRQAVETGIVRLLSEDRDRATALAIAPVRDGTFRIVVPRLRRQLVLAVLTGRPNRLGENVTREAAIRPLITADAESPLPSIETAKASIISGEVKLPVDDGLAGKWLVVAKPIDTRDAWRAPLASPVTTSGRFTIRNVFTDVALTVEDPNGNIHPILHAYRNGRTVAGAMITHTPGDNLADLELMVEMPPVGDPSP